MPTSLYMPSVVVEIAFNAGYNTPAASRTWTDVTDYVELSEGIDITYGRQDERSTADANQCSLTLDNSDGRFTAERAASPYYPNVKVGRPIRVKATPVGGSEQVRFTGFIDEWPVVWDGTDAYASARITASSRLARLGLNTALRSVIEEEALASTSPLTYYTLGEAEGAKRVADSSGNGRPPLVSAGSGAPVVFGQATGPGTDGLTAATFAGGQYLAADMGRLSVSCFSIFILTTAVDVPIFWVRDLDTLGNQPRGLSISATGKVEVRYGDTPGLVQGTSTVSVNDGATHHILWVNTPVGGTSPLADGLYIDGVHQGLLGPTDLAQIAVGNLRLGADFVGNRFTGTAAHFVLWGLNNGSTPLEHAAAGLNGFAGETAAVRLARYARWAQLPTTSVSAAGATTVAHLDSTGAQVTDMLRKVETAEDGVLHDSRDDVLTLRPRSARYSAASAFTLSMATQQVGADFQPKMDRSALLNDVTVTNTTGVTGRVVSAASRNEYGVAAETVETLADDAEEPYELAAWRIGTYASPRVRVPSLTVDILVLAGGGTPSPATVLAADVGTLFTVSGQPGQAPASSATYFVEGYTETIGAESYSMAFNVSPSYPYANVLLLDDATRGRLDQGNVLAH